MSVYLDYNATTPVRPSVVKLMQEVMAAPANPSSVHKFGRKAKKYVEDARKIIADSISVFPTEIVFTSSGTEANVMALKGFSPRNVLVSAVEHSSVLRQSDKHISVNTDGIVDLGVLDVLLTKTDNALVSVMLANNETGVIQPIAEIATICKKHNALLHCDAVQGLGKIPVDFGLLGCDMMTLSAHKCGGPVGAACLVVKQNLPIHPLITGGGQELGRRAGTENVAAIAGFGRAVEKCDIAQMGEFRGWRNAMEQEMRSYGATVFGDSVDRLPNTTCVAMPGVSNEVQLMDFDLKGVAVSAGSACSSGRIEPSHVLKAMQVPETLAGCAVRVSGGWDSKKKDMDGFLAVWKAVCERLSTSQKN